MPDLTITALLAASLIFASSAALKPGRADDVHLAGLGRERGKGKRRGRRGEIDDAIRLRKQRPGIAGQLDAVLGQACQHARVPADQRRTRVFQRARKREFLAVGDRLDQRAAHPPAGAGDHEPHLGHGFNSRNVAWV